MSFKPARGCGITFDSACKRERKYRIQLREFEIKPVGYMLWSKTYYHWLIAERDLQNLNHMNHETTIEQLYGQMISSNLKRSIEQHKTLCYKPLQKLMP